MLISLRKQAKTTPTVGTAIRASPEPSSIVAERYFI